MHRRFLVKHFFFCIIILSTGLHVTSSKAESVDCLPKTTSILSIFAKAVVMGLMLGSQVQALAFPVSQKQIRSLNKRQEQGNSSICVPNNDHIFYVGQNNFTRCLEQHPRGTFIFVEHIDFTQFPEDEKEKYPLYNNTVPFSGSLTMFPYSFDHFNITRSTLASMFSKAKNAIIRANLTHPDISIAGELNTASYSTASLVANVLDGHNTLEVELDSASVKVFGDSSSVGGVVGTLLENSINNISVKVKNFLNVSANSGGGGMIFVVHKNASLDLSAIIDALTVECNIYGCYGGVIGIIKENARVKVNLQGSLISIMDRSSMHAGDYKFYGGLYGDIDSNVAQLDNTNIQIDNVSIEGGVNSVGSALYAVLAPQRVNYKTTLIRGMHVNIQAAECNAVGVGAVYHPTTAQKISPLYLISINGTLGSPNHIIVSEGASCEGSMIDWSGVHLNTNNLGCTDALELETIRSEHWRQAHRLVAAELCQNKKSCFYVSEDLVALVKNRNNTFFLVTRQRYPYNQANDGQGVVRVIQYVLDNFKYNPTIDSSFAIDGTRLFTHATETLLPVERPLSTGITDDNQLLMLYGETGNLKVVSMPLMGMNDTTYTLHTVQSSAAPVQIDKDILWLNQEGNLLAYNVSDASTGIFFRNTTLSNSVHLIGAQRYQNYVYTAQLDNGTNIFMARFFNDGRQDANWTSYLPLLQDYNIRQLHIDGDTNEPIISFPKVSELFRSDFLSDFYLTVEIPPEGGLGKWRYGNESLMQTLLPATEPPTFEMTTDDGNDVIDNMTTTETITPANVMNSTNSTDSTDSTVGAVVSTVGAVSTDSTNSTDAHSNDNNVNTFNIFNNTGKAIAAASIPVSIIVIGSSITTIMVICHRQKVKRKYAVGQK